jgi:hypothetical protein
VKTQVVAGLNVTATVSTTLSFSFVRWSSHFPSFWLPFIAPQIDVGQGETVTAVIWKKVAPPSIEVCQHTHTL